MLFSFLFGWQLVATCELMYPYNEVAVGRYLECYVV